MVDGSLGQHGVVLQLRLAEGRGVASNHDELGLARAESCNNRLLAFRCIAKFETGCLCSAGLIRLTLESGLVTQSDLTRLHHKCETGVQGVTGLGLLLDGGHLD